MNDWKDLPCGAAYWWDANDAVGRLSDMALDFTDKAQVLSEIEVYSGFKLDYDEGAWSKAFGEPDCTVPLYQR